jgi:aldose 1-epimerase
MEKDETYQATIDGKRVQLYTIKNNNGISAKITNYAGKLVQLLVPDKHGQLGDVVLGYDSLEKAMNGRVSMGSTIGRYANRIAKGKFTLNGKNYQLTINNGPNHLHGGTKGSRFVVFDAKQLDERTLQLNYCFKDGEEGYPGNCNLKVVYALTDDNELKITYDAVTDQPTIVNFTNHAFWNLAGAGNGTILNHELTINADKFTPVDDSLITTGELRDVKGTPLDFTKPEKIGARIDSDYEQLKYGPGYDFNWILNKKSQEMSFAASVYEFNSGRVMEIHTTEPGLQMYSGNFFTGKEPMDIGKDGKSYVSCGALALETQHFPDSPNKENFPSTVLNPGQWFSSATIYKFSIVK